VTETEVQEGILKVGDVTDTTVWLRRTIEDIDQQENSYALSRYMGTSIFLQIHLRLTFNSYLFDFHPK